MNQYRRGLVLLSLAAFVATQLSAAPVIGVASTRGTIQIDNAAVRGTANVSEGSSVRTNETSGQVQLQNGASAVLSQRSAASVYTNRIELREGAGQVSAQPGFDLDALGFRISAAGSKAVTRVTYERPDRILVTAMDSPVKVTKNGVLLAKLNPGTTYYFEPGSADQQNDTAQSAGKTAGKKAAGSTAAKTGLSTAAKWGIVAAVAGGTGVGLGVALSGDDASR